MQCIYYIIGIEFLHIILKKFGLQRVDVDVDDEDDNNDDENDENDDDDDVIIDNDFLHFKHI
jgi:hypothetical protein